MPEEPTVQQETTGEPEGFEVGELNDESLDSVGGGSLGISGEETERSPGNSCINNVANC
jgi:hypothetical protein